MSGSNQGKDGITRELKTGWGKGVKWALGFVTAFALAIAGAIASPIVGYISHRLSPDSPNISVFDVAFLPNQRGYDDGLDVRVENTGSQVAYLTNIQVRVVRTWEVRPSVSGQLPPSVHQASTYTYTYQLPSPGSSGTDINVPVSQTMGAGETDRFSVVLKNDQVNYGRPSISIFVYLLAVHADYNGRNTPDRRILLAAISPASRVAYHTLGPGATLAVVARNRAVVREMLRFGAVRGPYLETVMAAIRG